MTSAAQAIAMQRPAVSRSNVSIWTGRIISGLTILFLIFDGVMKVVKDPRVLQAAAELGYPQSSMVGIGALLLGCTVLYAVPRTAIPGAVLLTGYLGGAVATNLRVDRALFPCIFPIIFGALVWAGLWLRDARLQGLLTCREAQ